MDGMGPVGTPRDGYNQFRGWRWVLGRVALALVGSVVCGACFGILNTLGIVLRETESIWTEAGFLMYGAFVGAVVGSFTSPLLIAVTTSSRPQTGYVRMLATTAAATFALGLMLSLEGVGVSVLFTAMVYGCACIAWRLEDGSGAYTFIPGRCHECGYDLGGLKATVCPECGAFVGAAPAEHQR